jgi:hypothetical protein
VGKEPQRRVLAIKKVLDYKDNHQGRNRVIHERRILARIKNGLSIFLPKYYLLAEKDDEYENAIFMDFIEFPNL